jgi:DNA-binding transcriptional ArsR family regulator
MKKSDKINYASKALRFTDEQFIWRFSPNQTDPRLLEAIFVGREPLLQNVLEKIADSATTGSTHHVLLYGPRGIGKSHFVSLLHHRLVSDDKLSTSVHIAWLNEDETTTSMPQLLVRIYRSLCKWYPDEYSDTWLDDLLNQSPEEITSVLTRRLVARFEKRKLVILVENLNLLFENLGSDGQHALRALLQEHPFACLVATSQQLFKAVTDRSEPFFGFFQQIALKPLSLPDAQQLLVKIAESKGQDDLVQFLNTPDGRGRVRAIHDLAGGNHRVYIVLSGFVTRESLDQLVAPFQKMADDLTPYYQERLRWVSPLQRQIVELLCGEHGTVNPKEIARRLLLDQRSIGKQVRILEEIGYLTSTKRGRETYYELSEPLMRLAYEVKEQSLLQMLIDFLRIWYRPVEMKEEVAHCDRSEALFAMNRWEEGFTAIRDAFTQSRLDFLGDTENMFSQIFQLSEDNARLQSRINTLVDLYQHAAEEHGFRGADTGAEQRQSVLGKVAEAASQKNQPNAATRPLRPKVNPLAHLGDGLVKSLGNIDARRVTSEVLESYVAIVEQRMANLPECEIPLRLFRYGIRYLISGKESEFVELIHPERRIVRQALEMPEEA